METNQSQELADKESVKLMKMSKGYHWEVKLLDEKINSATLYRLSEINKQLEDTYGETD